MKPVFKTPLLLILLSFPNFHACKNDSEIPAPEIILTELGYDNSKAARPGSDLHMDADIVAEGRIRNIRVTIHPETDSKSDTSGSGGWEYDSIFTEFSGLKNTSFHKDAEVPETADTGQYYFLLIVTDMEGNQGSVEEELLISTLAHQGEE